MPNDNAVGQYSALDDILRCPLCQHALQVDAQQRQWCCQQGHSFDRARQGYIHLLPVQQKRSKQPGDSRDMVMARRQFLALGHYQPLRDEIARLLAAHQATTINSGAYRLLDAGCGEGYYLSGIVAASDDHLRGYGVDISKLAVQAAAATDKNPDIRWLVASNANLPIHDESIDGLLSLFGFPVYREFARVLKSAGIYIQVDTGEQHLQQLRQIIYPQIINKAAPEDSAPAGFQLLQQQRLYYSVKLTSNSAIQHLLSMTPHRHRASQTGLQRLSLLTELALSVDFQIRVYQRQS